MDGDGDFGTSLEDLKIGLGATLEDNDEALLDHAPPAPQTDEQIKIMRLARKQFKRVQDWEQQARNNWKMDLRFAEADAYNGWQWPDDVRQDRDISNAPSLTINKTRQFCIHIINDAKQSKPSVDYRPTGNGATKESADVLKAMVRHIEYDSNAEAAYTRAIEFQVKAGYGYWRVGTAWESDDSWNQKITIMEGVDPMNLYVDPDCKQRDKSDMKFAFIFDRVEKNLFNTKYPQFRGHPPSTVLDTRVDDDGWFDKQYVRVAEYFRVVPGKDTLYSYHDPKTGELKAVRKSIVGPKMAKLLEADKTTRKRVIPDNKVMYYFLVGDEVVEEKEWPGSIIPIVVLIGEETIVDGLMDRKGHTRALLDPQKMYNYWAALSLDTPIPTPSGWKIMADIQTGDLLFNEKGVPCPVLGLSPIFFQRPCFEIEFDDGSKIITDANHEWVVEERGKRKASSWDWSTKTVFTRDLMPKKHYIYTTAPLELEVSDLPISPYVLGVWLGDGTTLAGQFSSHASDVAEMSENIRACGYEVGEPRYYSGATTAAVTIHNLVGQLKSLGVHGRKKYIPVEYLRASREQRIALFQGLMDTDGTIGTNNQCGFTTTSPALMEGFSELLRTLGIKSKAIVRDAVSKIFPNGETYTSQPHWQFFFTLEQDFPAFKLARKANVQMATRQMHPRRTKRFGIVSVTSVPSVPVRCLGIDSESHLFLAGPAMIPTHNSAAVEFGALQSKTPYLAPAQAIEGNEVMWNNANQENYSVLPWNHIDDDGNPIPKPERASPPMQAPLYIEGMKTSDGEMMAVSGQYQAQLGQQGNERTGIAIQERQRQGDNATYHYIDRQGEAIRLTGRIILELIPKIYDTKRVLQVLAEDGKSFEVEIDPDAEKAFQAHLNNEQQVVKRIFNPDVGTYSVQADVGPGYGTKREEAWNVYAQILTQNKELTPLIGDILFDNGDFPGAEEVSERMRRMVPRQALGEGPTAQEQKLQADNQQLQALQKEMFNKLTAAEMKLKGKDEMRDIDAYGEETKRIAALGKMLPTDQQGLAQLIHQLVQDSINTHLTAVVEANDSSIGQNAAGPNKSGSRDSEGAPPPPTVASFLGNAPAPQPAGP